MQRYTNHLWKLIELYPNKPWNWKWLSCNPNTTWEIIQDNLDKDWNWICISMNITWEIIQDNPDKPWNWWGMSINKFEKHEIIVTRNQKKGKRWIINYIDDKRLCPTAIAELIGDFVY